MKVLNSATQKNVLVDCVWYTTEEINELLDKHIFFTFDDNFKLSYEHINYFDTKEVRLFLNTVKELKVIYDRVYECYSTVAVLNDGSYIHISI